MKTEDMKDFLEVMDGVIEKEKIELFKKIIDSSEIKNYSNPREFFYAVLYQWDKFISGFLKSTLNANKDVVFIYKNSRYIDRHFQELFQKYEGSACSADKSRTIVNRLLKFYSTGSPIDFCYDGEYTYHLPKKIFKNHGQIISFYEGLKALLYGRPQKYIEVLSAICLDIIEKE